MFLHLIARASGRSGNKLILPLPLQYSTRANSIKRGSRIRRNLDPIAVTETAAARIKYLLDHSNEEDPIGIRLVRLLEMDVVCFLCRRFWFDSHVKMKCFAYVLNRVLSEGGAMDYPIQ